MSKVTAKDLIDRINEGWSNAQELQDLFEYVDSAEMDEDQLEIIRESTEIELIYSAHSDYLKRYDKNG